MNQQQVDAPVRPPHPKDFTSSQPELPGRAVQSPFLSIPVMELNIGREALEYVNLDASPFLPMSELIVTRILRVDEYLGARDLTLDSVALPKRHRNELLSKHAVCATNDQMQVGLTSNFARSDRYSVLGTHARID